VKDLNERLNGPVGVSAQLTKAQNDLRDELNKLQQEQDPKKIEQLKKEIDRLTKERDRLINTEIPDANDRLAEAQDKMNEPMPGAEHGKHGRHGNEYGYAKTFGQEFLSGIFEAIGLPNMSQFLPAMKSPLDFGSVKLGMGVLNWGLGMLGHMGGMGGRGPTHVSQPDPSQPGYNGPIIPGMASGNGFGANTALRGGSPGWWGSSPGPGNQPGGSSVHVAGDMHGDTYNIHPASDRDLVHAVQTHAASWERNSNTMNASSGIAHL
jgi:hypothetical protein